VTFFVVWGPPAAGKTTWVMAHARPGDLVVDLDALAQALDPAGTTREHERHVDLVAKAAQRGALHAIFQLGLECDVYLIHVHLDPQTRSRYERGGAQIVVVDPGLDTCLERARTERPAHMELAIREWYAAR
jgi:hypothetical protein